MKKILIVTSTDYFVRVFLVPYLKALVHQGWVVHVASAYDGEDLPYLHEHVDIPVERTPFSLNNCKAIKVLKQKIAAERYDIMHCHTPMGAFVGRMAARTARKEWGMKVIYTAHGFHFYRGASPLAWMLYYPAERYFAHLTDALITINNEDRCRAESSFTAIPHRYFLPGVGYDPERIESHPERPLTRSDLGIGNDDFVLLYSANLIARKNHMFLIDCLRDIVQQVPHCKLLLCGEGDLREAIARRVQECGLARNVIFTGFRWDIGRYLPLADVVVSTSLREGLPVSIIEALYHHLPVVISNISGHNDLVQHGRNGFLYEPARHDMFVSLVMQLYNDPQLRRTIGDEGARDIEKYSACAIVPQMLQIYDQMLVSHL